MKQKLRILYFNVSFVCVLLVGTELLGQIIYFVIKGHPLFESHTGRSSELFELHPYLVGRLRKHVSVTGVDSHHKDKTITTTEINTRWTGALVGNKTSMRVAVLGGSTTFGVRVTDADSWPFLLQDMLGGTYAVINYGMPGYSTAEAIIQMALIVPESKPHLVVLYEGWNDIKNYHDHTLGPDYFSHGMQQYQALKLKAPEYESLPPVLRLAGLSAICRFTSIIAQKLPQKAPTRTDTSVRPRRTADPYVDRIYLRNLHILKVLAKHMGAYALFVPQILNYAEFKGKSGSRHWSPNIEDDAMPDLLDRFNLIMNQVCQPNDANCSVLKEVMAVPWERDDFIAGDDGHFSRNGGRKFATIIAETIREKAHSIGFSGGSMDHRW